MEVVAEGGRKGGVDITEEVGGGAAGGGARRADTALLVVRVGWGLWGRAPLDSAVGRGAWCAVRRLSWAGLRPG